MNYNTLDQITDDTYDFLIDGDYSMEMMEIELQPKEQPCDYVVEELQLEEINY